MSQQLTLELSDETYASLQAKANSVGLKVSEWFVTVLNQQHSSAYFTVDESMVNKTEPSIAETALLSEPALAEDWNKPEEDAAWFHLQPDQ